MTFQSWLMTDDGPQRRDCVIANLGPMIVHKRGYQDHPELIIVENQQAYPAFDQADARAR